MDKDQQCFQATWHLFDEWKPLVCFDVGCNVNPINVGVHTDMTAMFLNSKFDIEQIYGFEPVHYQAYEERYRDNNKVTLVKKALGDAAGEAAFFCPKAHGLSSLINRQVFSTWTDGIEEKTVEVITVDEFIAETGIEHIDYIKIDVEGAELRVLKGATSTLKDGKITAGHFEYGIDDEGSKADIIQFLNDHGYSIISENDLNCAFGVNK